MRPPLRMRLRYSVSFRSPYTLRESLILTFRYPLLENLLDIGSFSVANGLELFVVKDL